MIFAEDIEFYFGSFPLDEVVTGTVRLPDKAGVRARLDSCCSEEEKEGRFVRNLMDGVHFIFKGEFEL